MFYDVGRGYRMWLGYGSAEFLGWFGWWGVWSPVGTSTLPTKMCPFSDRIFVTFYVSFSLLNLKTIIICKQIRRAVGTVPFADFVRADLVIAVCVCVCMRIGRCACVQRIAETDGFWLWICAILSPASVHFPSANAWPLAPNSGQFTSSEVCLFMLDHKKYIKPRLQCQRVHLYTASVIVRLSLRWPEWTLTYDVAVMFGLRLCHWWLHYKYRQGPDFWKIIRWS